MNLAEAILLSYVYFVHQKGKPAKLGKKDATRLLGLSADQYRRAAASLPLKGAVWLDTAEDGKTIWNLCPEVVESLLLGVAKPTHGGSETTPLLITDINKKEYVQNLTDSTQATG